MNKQPNGWLEMKNENIIWLCQELVHDVESRRFFFSSCFSTIRRVSARYGAKKSHFQGETVIFVLPRKQRKCHLLPCKHLQFVGKKMKKKTPVSMQITGQISATLFFLGLFTSIEFVANRARCLIYNFNRQKTKWPLFLRDTAFVAKCHSRQQQKNAKTGFRIKFLFYGNERCPRFQLEITIDEKNHPHWMVQQITWYNVIANGLCMQMFAFFNMTKHFKYVTYAIYL